MLLIVNFVLVSPFFICLCNGAGISADGLDFSEKEERFIIYQLSTHPDAMIPIDDRSTWVKMARKHSKLIQCKAAGFSKTRTPEELKKYFKEEMLVSTEKVPDILVQRLPTSWRLRGQDNQNANVILGEDVPLLEDCPGAVHNLIYQLLNRPADEEDTLAEEEGWEALVGELEALDPDSIEFANLTID